MSEIKISSSDQFIHENQTWDRALDYYKQENAYLKTRLSEVLDNNSDKSFLVVAEQFNNRFLSADDYIKEFRKDIRMQIGIIKQSLSGNHSQDSTMNTHQIKLRGEMNEFEKNILNLKNEFNEKILSFLTIS